MDSHTVTNYRTAQDLHQQALRQGILDDASNLLLREGLQALSMRRIAQQLSFTQCLVASKD